MTQMERNPLSDMLLSLPRFVSLACQDGRHQKGKSTLRFHIIWNLNDNISKFSRNLVYLQRFEKQDLILLLFIRNQMYSISS